MLILAWMNDLVSTPARWRTATEARGASTVRGESHLRAIRGSLAGAGDDGDLLGRCRRLQQPCVMALQTQFQRRWRRFQAPLRVLRQAIHI